MAHLLAKTHPASVLPAPAAAVAQVQVSLHSQESACSEETSRREDVKLGWGFWVPKGPFLIPRLPPGGCQGESPTPGCAGRQCPQQLEGSATQHPVPCSPHQR